jgi:hypothetical protein
MGGCARKLPMAHHAPRDEDPTSQHDLHQDREREAACPEQ